MNAKPLISIIIPVYNVEGYIKECINSVLLQTYKNIEIIIIDDGSVDKSIEIIKVIIRNDPRLFLFTQKNSGPGKARNVGMSKANGEYILFVDADDYIENNLLEQCVSVLVKNNPDICIFNGRAYDEDKKEFYSEKYFSINKEQFYNGKLIDPSKANIFNCHQPGMKLYSSSFLKINKIDFPENIVGEDVEFWLKCLLSTHNIYYIDISFYIRRIRKGSIMTSDFERNVRDRLNNLPSLLKLAQGEENMYKYVFYTYIPFVMILAKKSNNEAVIKSVHSFINNLRSNVNI